MSWLIVGVSAFGIIHLFPAVLPGSHDRLEGRLGENPYRGLFSLVIVGSLILIVFGWKSAVPTAIYQPLMRPGALSSVLILIGFVLFVASQVPGNLKRFIRHPQMTGTLSWGIAHLLTNGDNRSVVLFGGLTVWAVLEMLMINRRDGAWQKPEPAAIRLDVITAVVAIVAFAAVAYFHASLFGVSPVPAR